MKLIIAALAATFAVSGAYAAGHGKGNAGHKDGPPHAGAEHPQKPERDKDDNPHGRQKMNFESLDTDQDGKVSFDEFKTPHLEWIEKKFKRIDADNDGKISKAEHNAAMQKRQQHRGQKHGDWKKNKRMQYGENGPKARPQGAQ